MNKHNNQAERIHRQQDKENCYVAIGDTISITCKDGYWATGVILGFEVRKETTTKHPGLYFCMDIKELPNNDVDENFNGTTSVWVENITNLTVLKFKGEKQERNTHNGKQRK